MKSDTDIKANLIARQMELIQMFDECARFFCEKKDTDRVAYFVNERRKLERQLDTWEHVFR